MKKHSDEIAEQRKVYVSKDPSEIFRIMEKSGSYPELQKAGLGSFPMTEEMLLLLKDADPLPQEYHYIEQGKSFAFFTLYENRMDILTFGKSAWYMTVRTIAYPCSLSSSGYITNDLPRMLRYIKTLKGAKLVLNADHIARVKGMGSGETLPTCRLLLRPEHTSAEAYIASLRSTYRRRLRLAQTRCEDITVSRYGQEEGGAGGLKGVASEIYPLYLQTYEKSEYKLEKLEQSFFEEMDATGLVFRRDKKAAGFVLLKQKEDELIFLFCGMDYPEDPVKSTGKRNNLKTSDEEKTGTNADLYFVMLYHIVAYAIEKKCKSIDFGQTSENTKLKFGAELEKRYYYAHHSNPLLNLIAVCGRAILEYRYRFPDYRVFKEI